MRIQGTPVPSSRAPLDAIHVDSRRQGERRTQDDLREPDDAVLPGIAVKQALQGRNDASIMAEAARGEEIAVGAYANAVQASLPPPTRAIVERHQTDVRDTHDRVSALEQEWRHR
jgi:hypothetical protein